MRNLLCVSSSSLRPSLKPKVKSRILQTCLQSLYKLPPTETLESCLPPQESVPDVMVTALFWGRSVVLGGQFWGLGQFTKQRRELCTHRFSVCSPVRDERGLWNPPTQLWICLFLWWLCQALLRLLWCFALRSINT